MISAVVLTKNEEKNIKSCLKSISWCDEIIIIDDNSTDKTTEIARKTKAKIFTHPLNNDFAQQRNYGLSKVTGDWVIFVDADEVVSSALWYEIMNQTNSSINNYSGFYLKRKDIMWGKELNYGETGNIRLLRLAKKDAGEWIGRVHEAWKINGMTALLNNPLMHNPHVSVEKFLQQINFYTDLRSKELFEKETSVSGIQIVFYPTAKFIINYIFKQGFRDGVPGLLLAFMMSLHSFLVRGKLWLLWQRKHG